MEELLQPRSGQSTPNQQNREQGQYQVFEAG